jgi:hypothetical protein
MNLDRDEPRCALRSSFWPRIPVVLALLATACGGSAASTGAGGAGGGSAASGGGGGGAPIECKAPLVHCEGSPANACVDVASDAKNCGVCGVDCGGAMCTDGRCGAVTLVQVTSTDLAIGDGREPLAVDATDVYFTTEAGLPDMSVGIAKVPKAGGAVTPMYKTDVANNVFSAPLAFALDDKNLYFVDLFLGIASVPKAGGQPFVILPKAGGGGEKNELIINGDSLEFPSGAGIARVSKKGGSPTDVVQEAKLYGFTHDATAYYWLSCDFALRRQTPGGSPTVIAQYTPTGNCPLDFIATDNDLFFAGDYDGYLHQAGKDGTMKAEVQGKYSTPDHLAHNTTTVFWSEETAIRALPIAGGPPVDIITGLKLVRAIAADDKAIYWSEGIDKYHGAIKKMVLPR